MTLSKILSLAPLLLASSAALAGAGDTWMGETMPPGTGGTGSGGSSDTSASEDCTSCTGTGGGTSGSSSSTAMPGEADVYGDADFICDWSFNGATGSSTHSYTWRDSSSTSASSEWNRLWLHTGGSTHSLTLRSPTAVSGGTRWAGSITSTGTSLSCSVRIAADGSTIDYTSCVGTLQGTWTNSMSVYCDEL